MKRKSDEYFFARLNKDYSIPKDETITKKGQRMNLLTEISMAHCFH